MMVLGIETSCDETGVALYDSHRGLVGHRIHSQAALHAEYGGVVPEIASRDHVARLAPSLRNLLRETDVPLKAIDGVAYTAGPGLVGALLVGAAFGRGLALALKVPAVAVHHMEAHLLAPMLEAEPPTFPFVALLVSGGHTMLVAVEGLGRYQLLGESLDDAAGEAFDKTASLLGLPYPGGPALAALAEKGNPKRFTFPRPMTDRPGLDFSFSGLKTFALNTVKTQAGDEQTRADIARAFEEAVVDTLVIKSLRALDATGIDTLVLSGGVGANRRLRKRLSELGQKRPIRVCYPSIEFCTDNGAMVAYAGCLRLSAGQTESPGIEVRARWPLDDLIAPSAAVQD